MSVSLQAQEHFADRYNVSYITMDDPSSLLYILHQCCGTLYCVSVLHLPKAFSDWL